MGRVREETPSSLSEALLFTTMSIIGLPVEVYVKDGSIFSGIFHTISFHMGYGIVLKKVRMVKKGTDNSNVVKEGLIDTLVIRPGDLVQVLAKGVMLPADFASGDVTTYDGGAIPGTYLSSQDSDNGDVLAGEQLKQQRHAGMGRSKEEDGYHHASELIEELIDVNRSSATSLVNGGHTKLIAHEENQAVAVPNQLKDGSLAANGTSPNVKTTNQLHNEEPIPTKSVGSIGSDANACRSVVVPTVVAPQIPVTSKIAKESKLNPSAKIFSPSLSNLRSNPTLAATVSSVAYVSNSIPTAQIASPQPEVGLRTVAPVSSWPVKVVPYVTPAPPITDNSFQHGQPIASHVATRKQPVRHGTVYQPLQAVPSYLHTNHQNGMFGRPGQIVYVHPVTHDVIQGSAMFHQAPHPLLTSHPVHVTKHEGVLADQALQASMAPPLIANGQQPFIMPGHQIQFSQPLFTSSMRHVPILGPNLPYSTKFP